MPTNAPPVDEIDAFIAGVFDGTGVDTEPIWKPFPGKPQEAAYHCKADIIGYGGAGGGGKTDLGLGKGHTQFWRSVIFRREYPQLKGIIERGDAIQDGRCHYIAGEKKYWKTPEGRIVELGAVEHESDRFKWKGRPHDFIVFDEAVDFPESVVRFIMGWLRTERTDVVPQVLLTFNPPTTPEGEWVVKFFAPWIDPNYNGKRAEDGEMRWFITVGDKDVEVAGSEPVTVEGKDYTPKSRTFFKALVEDNPVYMATGYDKQLESLPEPLRSQLRWADFGVSVEDDVWQAIPTNWIIQAQNRYLQTKPEADLALRCVGVDPSRGGQDETSIAKLYGTRFEVIAHPGQSVPDGAVGARRVSEAMGNENAPVFVDVIGIGSSVYDHLKVMDGMKVTAVNVGAASTTKDRTKRYGFFNLRSQIVWQFREALDPNSGEDIQLPPDTQLRNDLRAAKFSIVGGKIKIESKPDIKKRIGRSPDRGEAVLLAWHGANKGNFRLFSDNATDDD